MVEDGLKWQDRCAALIALWLVVFRIDLHDDPGSLSDIHDRLLNSSKINLHILELQSLDLDGIFSKLNVLRYF